MNCIYIRSLFVLLYIACVVGIENGFLNVGEEQWEETLALQMGYRAYELRGLKPYTWYEVKISYPASIPASFSLQLKRGVSGSDLGLNRNRRLLETEKLIFKTESLDSLRNQDGMFVTVNVKPEGIVAIPNIREREYIFFNIVCDELLLGIPHKAWLAVAFVLLCLALAFTVPRFLLPFLLPNNHRKVSAS